jgi:hypothetical protein
LDADPPAQAGSGGQNCTPNKPAAPAAQLQTLADAAQLIADLEQFRQARPYWDRHHLNRIKTFGQDAQLALHGAGGSLWAIPSS